MFSVRRRGGLNPIIQQGSPTTLGLTAYCLLDTTLIGYNSDGEYELFISFTAAPEVPVVGPFRFELNNVGVTLPDDEDAVAQYDLSSYQLRSEKGLAEGYATLGLDGLVPDSQLPVTSGGGNDGVSITDVILSPSQLLDLHNTPIEIVPAPGANELLVPLGITIVLNYNTVPYQYLDNADAPRSVSGPILGWHGIPPDEYVNSFSSNALGDILRATESGVIHRWGFSDFDRSVYPLYGAYVLAERAILLWSADNVKLANGNSTFTVRFFYTLMTVPDLI